MVSSNQFYINIKDKPYWNNAKPFEQQTRDAQQFMKGEAIKLKRGLNINGVKIHPWLYWHINFWYMMVDIKNEDGSIEPVKRLASFRDNEWYYQQCLNRAQEQNFGIIGFGSRRISKSAFLSSYFGFRGTTIYGGELRVNSVIGGVQKDLDNISDYTDFGLDNLHPFFKMDKVGKDWSKGVTLGTRNTDNSTEIYSKFTITNVVAGAKASTQKAAGATPNTLIFDEIGKYSFLKTFNTAKYSIATEHGWRTIPILMGTGGETSESRDAQKMISNPTAYKMIAMDWEWLERRCKKPTWTKKVWGVFFPGQMSLDAGIPKKKTTLGKFLNNEAEQLNELEFYETQWAESTKIIEDRRRELKKTDIATYYDELMFIPLDMDDCFLDSGKNPFPTAEATKHLNEIRLKGDVGQVVDIHLSSDGSGKYEFLPSDKPIAKFPFEGGILDCAIKMFELPPEDNSFDFTFVGGLDHYKHVESTGDSIGSLYIIKRKLNINDEYSDSVVCSFSSRPSSMNTFNRTCEMILEAYGAQCLQENADISFQQYLEPRGKDIKLLANGQEIVQRMISSDSRQVNKYGLSPTPKNKEYLINLVISYCWEELEAYINKDGNEVRILGVQRIKDEELLQEILEYKPGKNVDRIVAFGHALVWARYLDDINVIPKVKGQSARKMDKEAYHEKMNTIREKVRNKYGSRRANPYGRR